MPHLIEFIWYRDISGSGWAIAAEEPTVYAPHVNPPGEAGTYTAAVFTAAVPGRPLRIIHHHGNLQPYAPLQQFPKLYDRFSRVGSKEELLTFVENFGPLTREGLNPGTGDNVLHLLDHAKQMARLIDACKTGQKKELSQLLGPKGIALENSPIGDVQARLIFDPITETPTLQFIPRNLLNGLWLQLAEYLSGNLNLAECKHCGKTFERGIGTGRRKDAKFCCAAHQITFNSKKRNRTAAQFKPAAE